MEFLRQYQLDIMLVMTGICSILALFVFISTTLSPERKRNLFLLEAGASLLLITDRLAYLFRGNTSTLGWWMVRISNFSVFFLSLFLIYAFDLYLIDLFTHEGKFSKAPRRLEITEKFCYIGFVLLIISQFTGLYYTFDDMNRYHRSSGQILCYLFPLGGLFLQTSVIIQYYKRFSRKIVFPVLLFTTLPVIATIIQIFAYGLSLTNMSLVGASLILYIFVLMDMNKTVEKANEMEISFLKEEQQQMQTMFAQTAEALARAIDAKDRYTHGHSSRVAEYAREIARRAGKSSKEVNEVYLAALLHDVGKIGIPDEIINKKGKLTDEEYAAIKTHPVIGNEILSKIKQAPFISVGAHYHHERYDGKGYPDGLRGEQIPTLARIIAVADSYDAMTSKRSYRATLDQNYVRSEIARGSGTQFDPDFARIMLNMIDEDTDYQMQEMKSPLTEESQQASPVLLNF